MRIDLRVLPLLLAVAIAPLGAQSEGDAAAYFSLLETPPGALPPLLSPAMLGRIVTTPSIGGQFGHISAGNTSVNAFAATLGVPAGTKAMVGVTAGYQTFDCTDCKGHFLAGLNAEGRLTSSMLGTGADAAEITVGLNGAFGYAHPSGGNLVTLTAGLPVALVSGGPTLKVAPFLTPGLGWGRASSDAGGSSSGTRFMLGGGIALQSTTRPLAANFGFQKIFINNGDAMFGVNVTYAIR